MIVARPPTLPLRGTWARLVEQVPGEPAPPKDGGRAGVCIRDSRRRAVQPACTCGAAQMTRPTMTEEMEAEVREMLREILEESGL